MPTAMITGITGQDGSYLAEQLLEDGYLVTGVVRRASSETKSRISHLVNHKRLELVEGDITDAAFMTDLIDRKRPDQLYNLAAMSFVHYSFNNPSNTMKVNAEAVAMMIAAVEKFSPRTRLYQASTSEMYGGLPESSPQDEETYFTPKSPYAVAKLAAHLLVGLARDRGLFACCGILFNHESSRRGSEFVTQKIVEHAVEVKHGKREFIELGNLDAKRDWGYAKDYVEGMRMMLDHHEPDDYVLATGETHTIRDFASWVLEELGLDFDKTIRINQKFMRPNEVKVLCGNPAKAKRVLGWEPKVKARELAKIMLDAALERYQTNCVQPV